MICAELEELAAELALGTVAGAERAAALSHLARCGGCRNQVEQLARIADRLLLVAPAGEPPPGFESRVLARLDLVPAAAPVRAAPVRPAVPPVAHERPGAGRRRVLVGVAAMALVAGLSGAGAATLLRDDGGRPTRVENPVLTALARDDAGRWMCRAVMYGDDPTWLVVSLDRTDGLNATFSVEALRSGTADAVPVGNLTITGGHGSLASVVALPPDHVDAIQVRDANGRVRYTMDFPPT